MLHNESHQHQTTSTYASFATIMEALASVWPSRLLIGLAVAQGALVILSNVLATKIWGFTIGGIVVTFDGGLITYPLTYIVCDLLIEFYGARTANFIALCSGVMSFVTYMSLLIARALPEVAGVSNADFNTVFSMSGAVFCGSVMGFYFSQFCNNILFDKIRSRFGQENFAVRFIGSSIFAHAVDVAVFNLIAFVGRMELAALLWQIVCAYFAGLLVEAILYYTLTRRICKFIYSKISYSSSPAQ